MAKKKENEGDLDNINDDKLVKEYLKEGINTVLCPCGANMVEKKTTELYESWMPIYCNECWSRVPNNETCYNCSRGRCWSHPIGYDICIKCASDSNRNVNKVNPNKKGFTAFFGKTVKTEPKKNNNNSKKVKNIVKMNPNNHISPALNAILTQNFSVFEKKPMNNKQIKNNEIHQYKTPGNDIITNIDKIAIMDELIRLSTLQSTTIKYLISNMNNNEKYDILNKINSKINCLTNLNNNISENLNNLKNKNNIILKNSLKNWKQWNNNELIEWIYFIENGYFYNKYGKIIKENVINNNIYGQCLHIFKDNLVNVEMFGIKDVLDRKKLSDNIGILLSDDKVKDGNVVENNGVGNGENNIIDDEKEVDKDDDNNNQPGL